MNSKRNFPGRGWFADNFYCFGPSIYFSHKQDAQDSINKLLLSDPVLDLASLIENPPFLQSQFPFIVHAKNVQTPNFSIGCNNACLTIEPGERIGCKITQPSQVPSVASFVPNLEASMNNYEFSAEKRQLPFRSVTDEFVDCYSLFEQNTNGKTSWPTYEVLSEARIKPNFEDAMNNNDVPSEKRIHDLRFAKETSANGHFLFRQNTDQQFGNVYSSSYHRNDLNLEILRKYFNDQYIPNADSDKVTNPILAISDENNSQVKQSDFNYKKDEAVLSNRRVNNHIDNESSLNSTGNEQYIQNVSIWNMALRLLTNEKSNSQIHTSLCVDEIENECLSRGHEYKIDENEISCIYNKQLVLRPENYAEVSNDDFMRNLQKNYISIKYCQFYSDIPPEDYDFTMNIMAYIEFLNDSTWNVTVTYFEETVKNMVRNVWDENKNTVNSNSMLEQFYPHDFLSLMEYFSNFAFEKKYNLYEFLAYCVMMCQLGVLARKRNFKEAPLYVINYMRKGIGDIEDKQSIIFEVDLNNCAQKLSHHKQM